jgi:hypothetical protein
VADPLFVEVTFDFHNFCFYHNPCVTTIRDSLTRCHKILVVKPMRNDSFKLLAGGNRCYSFP